MGHFTGLVPQLCVSKFVLLFFDSVGLVELGQHIINHGVVEYSGSLPTTDCKVP